MKIMQSARNGSRKVLPGLIPVFYIVLLSFILVGVIAVHVTSVQAGPTVQVAEGDEWRYFKGTTKPQDKWTGIDFDDTNWLTGATGLGYGINYRTNLNDMQNNYSAVYARRQFTIRNIYAVTGMTLSILCDAAYVAYLNSVEIIRNDSPNKTISTADPKAEVLDVSGFIHELLPGQNVLAVECHNDHIGSRDFSFIPVFAVIEDQGGHAK